jgi:hypothetical protein
MSYGCLIGVYIKNANEVIKGLHPMLFTDSAGALLTPLAFMSVVDTIRVLDAKSIYEPTAHVHDFELVDSIRCYISPETVITVIDTIRFTSSAAEGVKDTWVFGGEELDFNDGVRHKDKNNKLASGFELMDFASVTLSGG